VADGSIVTSGATAFGILAQSIGSGGGILSTGDTFAAGSTGSEESSGVAKNITISQAGTISVTGDNSVGIFAQTDGVVESSGGNGNPAWNSEITIAGHVTGGGGTLGAGVMVAGGHINVNTLLIESTGNVSALSGMAVTYSGATGLNVTNQGTLTGSLSLQNLDGDVSTFENQSTARFNAGGIVIANFTDYGITAVAGAFEDEIGETLVTGDYTQMAGAVLEINLFGSNPQDYAVMKITGDGSFSGHLNLWFSEEYLPNLYDTFTFLEVQEAAAFQFATKDVFGLSDGYTWDFTEGTSNGWSTYSLMITAVPEPSTAVLWLSALLFLSARRQLRRLSSPQV
jgi:hypothetical protein